VKTRPFFISMLGMRTRGFEPKRSGDRRRQSLFLRLIFL
jgi:hypothetical protein